MQYGVLNMYKHIQNYTHIERGRERERERAEREKEGRKRGREGGRHTCFPCFHSESTSP